MLAFGSYKKQQVAPTSVEVFFACNLIADKKKNLKENSWHPPVLKLFRFPPNRETNKIKHKIILQI